jgi:putative NIF3 family GTP cyclohydrolase 1 type 2
MNPRHLSRREFVAAAAGAAAPFVCVHTSGRAASSTTANEVVERIKRQIDVPWKADTIDGFKAGDPASQVTGIVTTSMATIDVLRRAVKAGANLVVTCEPTFYARADSPTPPGRGAAPSDAVFAAKQNLINTNRLVIWRFSDHWRLRTPDPLVKGLAQALGWQMPAAPVGTPVVVARTTLGALASTIKRKLNARGGIRVVGMPQLAVQRISLLPGTTPIQAALALLPTADVVIAGEVREWESVEYARDNVTAGNGKGLILVGRVLSEDPGMSFCAQWLKTVVPEVPSTWIPVGDPYWRPV